MTSAFDTRAASLRQLGVGIPKPFNEIHAQLSVYINRLIKNDFDKLITYLYRIDVNEQKLKSLLQQNPNEDAGNIIATLIIERQQQKIKIREQFIQQNTNFDAEEKW